MKNLLKIIKIDEYSATPKYQQIYNSLIKGIEQELLKKGDILSSIHDLSTGLEVSKSTVERAYNELKKKGILNSVNGKGYYIEHTAVDMPIKIMLLFNKLSSHKKIIYDAFAEKLGDAAAIDFYIYNNNFKLFKKLLAKDVGKYAKIVIIPHFVEDEQLAIRLINELPKEKLVLMDKLPAGVQGLFAAVYEDFESDIFLALEQLKDQLRKYSKLNLIFPSNSYYSKGILAGFEHFCRKHGFSYAVMDNVGIDCLQVGAVYINLIEDDLVILIEKILSAQLKIGKDIGVISYNETPIKKLILDGITTISTDFRMIGEQTAQMILDNQREHLAIPFNVTLRKSI